MTIDVMSNFFEDYDDASSDVIGANHKVFTERLRIWFQTLDSNPLVSSVVQSLESLVVFDKWYADQCALITGMVGSGTLRWPADRDASLGLHLSLLRAISTDKIDSTYFAMNFLDSGTHYDTMVSKITTLIFMVAKRDLHKKLVRPDTYTKPIDEIPAADRVVRRDDNASAFNDAISATRNVVSALEGINDYPNVEEKQRLIAEIAAGQTLLLAPEVRAAAVWSTVWSAIKFLVNKFLDGATSKLLDVAIFKLAALFGFVV